MTLKQSVLHNLRQSNKQRLLRMPRKSVTASKCKLPKLEHIQNETHLELETPLQKIVAAQSFLSISHQHNNTIQVYQMDEEEQVTVDCEINDVEKISQTLSNLFAKNKISSKNAFDVPIIDINMLKDVKKDGEGSWTRISSTLENSSKIYGFRVDSVVANLAKMSTSMVRSEQNQELTSAVPKQQHITKQQIQKLQTNFEFGIEKDHQKLNLHGVENRDNPLLQQVRRKFDQNGVNGMLLGTIPIQKNLELTIHKNQEYIDIQPTASKQGQLFTMQLPIRQMDARIPILDDIHIFRKFILNPDCMLLIDLQDPDQLIQLDHFFSGDHQVNSQLSGQEVLQQADQLFLDDFCRQKQSMKQGQYSLGKQEMISKDRNNAKKKSNNVKMRDKNKQKKKKTQKRTQKTEIQFDSRIVSSRDEVFQIQLCNFVMNKTAYARWHDKNLGPSQFPDSTAQLSITAPLPKQAENENALDIMNSAGFAGLIKQQISILNRHSNFTNLSQLAGQCQRNINIGNVKKKINTIINTDLGTSLKFTTVYDEYQHNNNGSEQLCFLSILHLCNENNFELQEYFEHDFIIKKPE